MLSVEEALARVTAGLHPVQAETVGLEQAHRRVLAENLNARLTQPPFDSSAMDGYAVRAGDLAQLPASLRIIGEAAAGHQFDGEVQPGEAVRIFTGAPVPPGADAILIQENATRDGNTVTATAPAGADFIRPRGFDFKEGDMLLPAGRRLGARDLAVAAAMNVASLPVRRRPKVAILATGDELVLPGETPRADQIISSIPYGVMPMIESAGGKAMRLGIARDTLESLAEFIAMARDAEILLTIGGASVGEHDLVRKALEAEGMRLDFWQIAMRPGKPLMFGRLDGQSVLGVPGNPASAILCTRVFLVPMLQTLLGLGAKIETEQAVLATALPENGSRQHYMRATLRSNGTGTPRVTPARSQDSSLLTPLAEADCLIVRPPTAPAARAGETVPILFLDF